MADCPVCREWHMKGDRPAALKRISDLVAERDLLLAEKKAWRYCPLCGCELKGLRAVAGHAPWCKEATGD